MTTASVVNPLTFKTSITLLPLIMSKPQTLKFKTSFLRVLISALGVLCGMMRGWLWLQGARQPMHSSNWMPPQQYRRPKITTVFLQ